MLWTVTSTPRQSHSTQEKLLLQCLNPKNTNTRSAHENSSFCTQAFRDAQVCCLNHGRRQRRRETKGSWFIWTKCFDFSEPQFTFESSPSGTKRFNSMGCSSAKAAFGTKKQHDCRLHLRKKDKKPKWNLEESHLFKLLSCSDTQVTASMTLTLVTSSAPFIPTLKDSSPNWFSLPYVHLFIAMWMRSLGKKQKFTLVLTIQLSNFSSLRSLEPS